MATDKIHIPATIQKLWGMFADNGQPFNKNKLLIITLVLVASLSLGIFAVNIINLVNSNTPAKTTMITEVAAPQTAPVKATPVQTAPQTAPGEAAPIQAAPTISVEEKPAAPAPEVENADRFTIDNHLYRAREHEIKGEYSLALARYQKVINIEKDNFIVLNNISYIYLQLDLLSESIEYSLRAININSDYVPSLTNIGIAYAKTGDLSNAEYNFVRALKLEPENQDVRLNLALLLEKQERFTETSGHYLKLVKFGNLSGALGLARVYEKESRFDEAVRFYMNIYNSASIDSNTKAFVRQRIIILQNNQIKTGN